MVPSRPAPSAASGRPRRPEISLRIVKFLPHQRQLRFTDAQLRLGLRDFFGARTGHGKVERALVDHDFGIGDSAAAFAVSSSCLLDRMGGRSAARRSCGTGIQASALADASLSARLGYLPRGGCRCAIIKGTLRCDVRFGLRDLRRKAAYIEAGEHLSLLNDSLLDQNIRDSFATIEREGGLSEIDIAKENPSRRKPALDGCPARAAAPIAAASRRRRRPDGADFFMGLWLGVLRELSNSNLNSEFDFGPGLLDKVP